MKMLCPDCDSTMLIIRSRPITKGLREFVGECTHPDCRAKAVLHLSLSHYLRPPESSVNHMMHEYLSQLPELELKKLTEQVTQTKAKQGDLF